MVKFVMLKTRHFTLVISDTMLSNNFVCDMGRDTECHINNVKV